ncbi:MAG: ABC transporter ATP-binding protein [Alphaproteobacteria bacterium RIFCSPHIGHO2_02_FULL_46_13]|nr:MAG: ABC transporter ATP-binding protein [Alphaproteobacteria bacterium RIFCSPHIGHO2_02_FULL_46_13]
MDLKPVIMRADHISRTLTTEALPVTLVKEASVEIRTHEFTAIKGPSGSGKSSLLYLLGLLDSPTSGKIFIDDVDITGYNQKKLAQIRLEQMGFVFQFHFLLPEFTSLENVTMPMRRLGKLSDSEIKKVATEKLDKLGLADHLDKLPSQLSGGQRQRVAIARALANNPRMIFADEPTGNLDTESSKTVQEILKKLSREDGCAVVAVTHDPEFAKNCDRTITIVDGRIVA